MRHEPQQARAVATREALLAAARELYADPNVGRDRMTSNQVVALAGKSIGTFYRYFDDEVDILDAIEPDRDYPSMEVLEKVERWVADGNTLRFIADTPREIIDFLMETA